MSGIGDYFGVHYMTVSRAVRRLEQKIRRDIGMLELTRTLYLSI